jgi:hypothetical protein
MYNSIWNKEELPQQWLESTAVTIDTGDKTEKNQLHTHIHTIVTVTNFACSDNSDMPQ